MKLLYNGTEIGNIITNHSLTIEEALYVYGYDVDDQKDMEKAYNDGFIAAYLDDNGDYQIDMDGFEMEG